MTLLEDLRRWTCVALAMVACALSASGDETATCRKQTPPDVTQLKDAMSRGRFVSYQPTSLKIVGGRATLASEADIADDLMVLRKRFDGLITYSALNGAERIPDVAATMGFRAVIVGVWDISNQEEIANAIAAWRRHPDLVVGISLGNEIVFGKRGSFESIRRALAAVRAEAGGVPLTTSEPFHLFYDDDAAPTLGQIDFMLVNVHPVFQPWFAQAPTENAARFVVNVVDRLAQIYCGPILVKETGEPTAPAAAGYSPSRQADFYRILRNVFASTPTRAFAYFAAFDAPWRVDDSHPVPGYHPEEGHWGLYDDARKPKAVVATIPEL
jgi:exo-beta-1,3-glucanase (GH17 family)